MNTKELKAAKQEILDKIAKSNNICILISDPDEDAIGSGLALEEILSQKGIKSTLISNFNIDDYSYLPRFRNYTITKIDKYDFGHYDVVIILDSGSLYRILDPGLKDEDLNNKLPFTINIDHHPKNTLFGNINWVTTKVSSTGEALYDIFKDEMKLTESLSTNLLASIIGDTGCFKYPNAKSSTFEITAKLLKHGADHQSIVNNIFYSMEKRIFQLNQDGIRNIKIATFGNFNIMHVTIDPSQYGMKDVSRKQRHLLQEAIRTVKGIDFSLVLVILNKKLTRLSFRSSTRKINHIAQHFGGGGHELAAGAVTEMSPQEVLKGLKKFLKNK